jgi:hypothetical protein
MKGTLARLGIRNFKPTLRGPAPAKAGGGGANALPNKAEPCPPMALGSAAATQVRLIVHKACSHQIEPDPAEMAARYGAERPLLDWRERLGQISIGDQAVSAFVNKLTRRLASLFPPTQRLKCE